MMGLVGLAACMVCAAAGDVCCAESACGVNTLRARSLLC